MSQTNDAVLVNNEVPSEEKPKLPAGIPYIIGNEAAERYENFLRTRGGKMLFLELGVGYNTPGIIKFPFWQMTAKNPEAVYACVNFGEAVCPEQIGDRSVCIDGDIGEALAGM